MTVSPLARRSLADAVFDHIAAQVTSGDARPGDALPSERELAEALGINRGAVREGLQRLAQAGLVAVRHGGATRVLDFRRTAGLDVLPRLLARPDGGLDHTVARSIVEMRAALAPDIARLAALRAGAGDVAALDRLVAAMRGADGQLALLAGLSLDFWDVLVRASGNVAYELAYNGLRRTYEPVATLLAPALEAELTATARYAGLAAAVASGAARRASDEATTLVGLGTEALLDALDRIAAPPAEEAS